MDDKHDATGPAAATAPAAGRPPRRRLRRLLLLPIALLVIAVGVVFVMRNVIARRIIERDARAAGFALVLGEVEVDWGSVALREVDVTLLGVPELRGRIDRATITLDGFAPGRIDLRGVGVAIEGAPGPVLRDLLAWAAAHEAARALRVEASELRVRWAGAAVGAADPGWITISGSARWSGKTGVLQAAQVTVAGRELPALPVSWSVDDDGLAIGIASEDPASAPLRVTARAGGDAGRVGKPAGDDGIHVEATLQPLPLSQLLRAGVLSSSRAVPGAQGVGRDIVIDAAASFVLPTTEDPRSIEGTASASLVGYVPPHPIELDGILFGDRTAVTTRITIEPDRDHAKLTGFSVTAGALKMTGQGTVERAAARGALDHAVLDLRLAGSVACSTLTRSAVTAHLGKLGGDLFGDLAKRALAGSVAVTVVVAADTRDLAAARITPSARVGCTLRGF